MALGSLLAALASTNVEKTCLAGFQKFGDKCITTVNTGKNNIILGIYTMNSIS